MRQYAKEVDTPWVAWASEAQFTINATIMIIIILVILLLVLSFANGIRKDVAVVICRILGEWRITRDKQGKEKKDIRQKLEKDYKRMEK